jgi:hypothetical protein
VRIATNVAESLDYAHRHDVIHRDIKPANVRPVTTREDGDGSHGYFEVLPGGEVGVFTLFGAGAHIEAMALVGDFASPELWDLHPDGDRIIVGVAEESVESQLILVQNWLEELKQRVPTN